MGNNDWLKKPQSLLGWVLYYLTEGWRKFIIVSVTIVFLGVLGTSYYFLFIRENLEIRKMIQDELKDEQLKYWKRSDDPAWKSALLNIWIMPGDVPQDIWNQISKENDLQVLIAAAGHPWVLSNLKERLITEASDVRVRIAGILNRSKKKEVIELLANDENETLRSVVAAYPETPPEILNELVKEDSLEIHRAIAMNVKAQPELLRVVKEKNEDNVFILRFIAAHPNTSVDILKELAIHEDGSTREQIAANRSTPPETLRNLAGDGYYKIRMAVGSNPMTPKDILEEWMKEGNPSIKGSLASNPSIPLDTLLEWIKSGSSGIKIAIASNAAASPDMLTKLSKDKDSGVLYAVALNSKTESKVLEEFFSKMKSKKIFSAVAANPGTPQSILTRLAEDGDDTVRAKVAGNRRTPGEKLKMLSRDSKVNVVIAVAGNLSTPSKILSRLAVNDNGLVRKRALSTILLQPKDKWRQ